MSFSLPYPIAPKDWLSDDTVTGMTISQEGAYNRLLLFAWLNKDCGLPDDDSQLATLSKCGESWFNGDGEVIRKCFISKNGRLFNQKQLRIRQAIEGKQLPEVTDKQKKMFETFWKIYPARDGVKQDKKETQLKFYAINEDQLELLIKATINYARSKTAKDGYAKDPKRFLRDGRGNEPWRDWIEIAGKADGHTGRTREGFEPSKSNPYADLGRKASTGVKG